MGDKLIKCPVMCLNMAEGWEYDNRKIKTRLCEPVRFLNLNSRRLDGNLMQLSASVMIWSTKQNTKTHYYLKKKKEVKKPTWMQRQTSSKCSYCTYQIVLLFSLVKAPLYLSQIVRPNL